MRYMDGDLILMAIMAAAAFIGFCVVQAIHVARIPADREDAKRNEWDRAHDATHRDIDLMKGAYCVHRHDRGSDGEQ